MAAELNMWVLQSHQLSSQDAISLFHQKTGHPGIVPKKSWEVFFPWEGLQGCLGPLGPGHVLEVWPEPEADKGQPSTHRLVSLSLDHIPPPGRKSPNCYQYFRDFTTR